jgi:hypothetical protein
MAQGRLVNCSAVALAVGLIAGLAIAVWAAPADARGARRPSARAAQAVALPVASRVSKRLFRARWEAPDDPDAVVRLERDKYALSGVFDEMSCRRHFRANDRFCIATYMVTYIRRDSGTSAGAGFCAVGVSVYKRRHKHHRLRAVADDVRTIDYCGPYPDTEDARLIGGVEDGPPVVVHPAPSSVPAPVLPNAATPPVTDGSSPPPIDGAEAAVARSAAAAVPPSPGAAVRAHVADLNTDLGAYIGYQGPYYAQQGFWFYLRWYDFRQTAFGLNSGLAYTVQWYYAYGGAWWPWFQQYLVRQTCQGGTGWDWAQTVPTC